MTMLRGTGPGAEEPANPDDPANPDPSASDQSDIAGREVAGLSQSQVVRRRFVRHRGAMTALAVLIALVVLVTSSIGWGPIPGWWRYDYFSLYPILNGREPTLGLVPSFLGGGGLAWGEHPFGQDEVGHDYFAAVMRGAQQSLVVVVITGTVAAVVGVLVGATAGYFRGWADSVLMRITDVIIIIPLLIIASVISIRVADLGVPVLAAFLGLVVWTGLARLVRGDFLALREREFVDAARVAGASSRRIIFKHILPNAVGVIIVNTTLLMAAAILLETALSYLGLGVQAPDTSLGLLISVNQSSFSTRPFLFWWPAVFIVLIALTVNFIGDGLRDAYDPRQRKGMNRKARRQGRG